jgi:dTMP kinase
MKVGKYVVIEGHDGTGKSTQVGLIRQKLKKCQIDSIEFHEPAGSPMADEIRNVIKNGSLKRDAMTNLLLFSAARHEIWQKKAVNALNKGKWVIASRNYYSTLAYQGYGENLDLDIIENITRQSTGNRYMNPDIAIILDMDDETERVKRINIRGQPENPDTFESKDNTFQSKVRQAYLKIAKSRNIPIISANQSIEKMTDEIWGIIKPYIKMH